MNKFLTIAFTLAGAIVGGLALRYNNSNVFKASNKSSLKDVDVDYEELNDLLEMEQVVIWFRNQQLDEKKDIPFIIRGDNLSLFFDENKYDGDTLFMGVYEESSDTIVRAKAIHAKAFDKRLNDALVSAKPDNPVVVLK